MVYIGMHVGMDTKNIMVKKIHHLLEEQNMKLSNIVYSTRFRKV
jgi:hypothetical protein